VQTSLNNLDSVPDTASLLTEEARLSKQLFMLAARASRYGEFTRAKRGSGADAANRFLDHGNYLAYGLAATATWALGLPHGLAVLHGKTRRGGLVFDVADLVKDAVILPQAFLSAVRGDEEQEFRSACIESLTRSESLDFMIDTVKAVADEIGRQLA
jgi:CRISP-associated protein Cas1